MNHDNNTQKNADIKENKYETSKEDFISNYLKKFAENRNSNHYESSGSSIYRINDVHYSNINKINNGIYEERLQSEKKNSQHKYLGSLNTSKKSNSEVNYIFCTPKNMLKNINRLNENSNKCTFYNTNNENISKLDEIKKTSFRKLSFNNYDDVILQKSNNYPHEFSQRFCNKNSGKINKIEHTPVIKLLSNREKFFRKLEKINFTLTKSNFKQFKYEDNMDDQVKEIKGFCSSGKKDSKNLTLEIFQKLREYTKIRNDARNFPFINYEDIMFLTE